MRYPFLLLALIPAMANATALQATTPDPMIDLTRDLVLVGLLQAAVFVLQLFVFGYQAYQLRKTVALTQAQSGSWMDAERAWIMFTDVSPVTELAFAPTGIPNVPRVSFSWTNYGKTTGLIVKGKARLIKVSSFDELPPEPDYGELWDFKQDVPLLPNNSRPEMVVLEQDQGPQEDLKSLMDRRAVLIFYGVVYYKDIFNRPLHETRFCLVYEMPGPAVLQARWIYGGTQAYNRHT